MISFFYTHDLLEDLICLASSTLVGFLLGDFLGR